MAKYQQYEQYKESGIEWLGDIPSYWEINRHKYVASFTKGKNPQEIFDEYSPDYYPYLSMDSLRGNSAHKYAPLAKNLYLVNENQPLIIWDGSNAGEFVRGRRGILSSTMAAAKLNCMMNPNYYWYLCMCIEPEMRKHANGMGIPHVNGDELKNISLVNPSLSEQSKIANFLDYETAQIDTLIEKQQTLIQLLKEKRQAVISHAVTKGLNPDAPMKDSGVEWLGEVPEHWVVAQLKFNTLVMQTGPFGSQLHAEEYIEDGIPLINPAHMIDGEIVPDSRVTVDEATQERLERHKLSEGDIIFARRGELGRCAIVHKHQEGWICGTGSLRATLNDKLISEYAYLLITSDGLISELSLESKGSTMDNLNTETLGRVRMPVPPRNEQNEIISHVRQVFGKYKVLIGNAEQAIQLMQERRTALISAAVTGKIDVRGWRASDIEVGT